MSLVKSIFVPKYSRNTKRMSIKIFFKLFVVFLLLTMLSNSMLYSFMKDVPSRDLEKDYNIYQIILLLVIFVPLMEEVCFRLWLKNGLFYTTFSILGSLFLLAAAISGSSTTSIVYVLAIVLSVVLLLTIFLSRHKPRVFIKHYHYFYYISVLAFGLMHLGNYTDINLVSPWYLPLLAFPYIMAGFMLGYTRITYGFRYGLLIHMSINLVATLL